MDDSDDQGLMMTPLEGDQNLDGDGGPAIMVQNSVDAPFVASPS